MCSVLEYLSLDDSSQEKWTFYYFILSWGAELGNGMIQTITGPMQPYLAYNLDTDTSTINLVWTLGFIGFLIGSILTSSIFTKHLHTGSIPFFLGSELLCNSLCNSVTPKILAPLSSYIDTD